MIEIERLVLAGVPTGDAERLRPGPGFERGATLPDRGRGIERGIVVLETRGQMEFDETRHLGQLGVAIEPDLLEVLFGSSLHAEAVHGDEHGCSPICSRETAD